MEPAASIVDSRAVTALRGSSEKQRPIGVDWRRAEFVLTLLAFLGFLALPIRITTIYSSLPAHPLFVHVPVVLIPVTVITAIIANVCIIVPRTFFCRTSPA